MLDDTSTISEEDAHEHHPHRIPPPSLTGTYAVDPTHSRIGFVARHAMVTKVRGSFNEFEGSGSFDAENPTAPSCS